MYIFVTTPISCETTRTARDFANFLNICMNPHISVTVNLNSFCKAGKGSHEKLLTQRLAVMPVATAPELSLGAKFDTMLPALLSSDDISS